MDQDQVNPLGEDLHRPRRPTINDVARAAGVSRQTVSNVVRARGRVGTETRRHVLQMVEKIGYQPHAGARSLRSRLTGNIGHPVVTSELRPENLDMVEFLQALVTASTQRDHRLLLAEDRHPGLGSIEALISSGSVDGFVLADVARNDPRAALLTRHGVPFVCFGRPDDRRHHRLPTSWVDIDNHATVRTATEHLLAAGHRRIGFVGYGTEARWDDERERGYRDAMAERGMASVVSLAAPGSDLDRSAIERLLDSDEAPTAIVAGSDLLAAAAYAVAGRRGLEIGTDLVVTGVGGGVLSRILTPTLTTMVIPFAEIASRLVGLLLAEIAGAAPGTGELVPVELLPGQSG